MGKINMICIILFVLLVIHSAQQMKLDGGTFLIQNKVYPHAHLSMTNVTSIAGRPVNTEENNVAANQFWILKKSSHQPGCYYIYNAYYRGFRVGAHKLGETPPYNRVSLAYANNETLLPEQLWKFLDVGAGNYRIYNCKYKTDRLIKWRKDNSQLQMYRGTTRAGEIWKLVEEKLMKLDGGTFLIQNKVYPHSYLEMETNKAPLGQGITTSEGRITVKQFWILKRSSQQPDYYYIYNAYYKGWKLSTKRSFNGGTESFLISQNKMFIPRQWWKFANLGAGNYRIYNYYKNEKLRKWAKCEVCVKAMSGPNKAGEIWELVPRYFAAISYKVLWDVDNRNGSRPFSETISVTYGLKLTRSSSISTKNGLELALKASAEVGLEGIGSASFEMETKIFMELTRSLSNSREENWSRTSEIVFTAPPHKNYRVLQLYAAFRSPLGNDNLELRCDYKIEESDGDF